MTSAQEFADNLAASGLLTAAEIRQFESTLSPETTDALMIARELVRRGYLTRYQAAAVYQGKLKGLILGDYVILDKLGSGGMGLVFKAQHRRMKRIVALKLLSPNVTKSPAVLDRFQREVEAAAKLIHVNIVTAYDAGEHNRVHYLVMEYVDGKNLSEIVRAHGPLSVKRAVNYIVQAARGLQHAHAEGVVHRDIKPANLLLDQKDHVKVLDMGLARFHDMLATTEDVDDVVSIDDSSDSELTQAGAIFGTLDFMAPEQAVSTRNADRRADIYGLGCSLHYLLTAQALFPRNSAKEKIAAHRSEPIPDIREMRPDVSEELQLIYARMLAKHPDDRFQSMQEVIDALGALDVSGTRPKLSGAALLNAAQVPDDSELLRFLHVMDEDSDQSPNEETLERADVFSLRRYLALIDPTDPSGLSSVLGTRRGIHYAITVLLVAMLLMAGSYLASSPQGTAVIHLRDGDAIVFVDGQRLAGQPLQGTGAARTFSAQLTPGTHVLAVTRGGSQPYVKEFDVEQGKTLKLMVDLKSDGSQIKPLNHWPGDTSGLEFAWADGQGENRVGLGQAQQWNCSVVPRGFARLNRGFRMELGKGAFMAEATIAGGINQRLLQACRKSGQLSIEVTIVPENLAQSGPARIISFSEDNYSRNFTLGQEHDRLVFRLRTADDQDADGSKSEKGRRGNHGENRDVELCRLQSGKPQHIIVSYMRGILVCYVNGEAVSSSLVCQGDFSNWTEQNLIFGDEWNGGRDWKGELDGVAILSRFVGAEEARQRYRLSQPRILNRPKPWQLRATLVLEQATPLPTLFDIAPARQALVVHKYQARFKGGGEKARTIRVAHWAILDGKAVPTAAKEPRQELQLSLERFDDNPQLANERLIEANPDAKIPLFYDFSH